jgi:hypothetical protein
MMFNLFGKVSDSNALHTFRKQDIDAFEGYEVVATLNMASCLTWGWRAKDGAFEL